MFTVDVKQQYNNNNDCPNMTLDVYRGHKTTNQQQQQIHGTISLEAQHCALHF